MISPDGSPGHVHTMVQQCHPHQPKTTTTTTKYKASKGVLRGWPNQHSIQIRASTDPTKQRPEGYFSSICTWPKKKNYLSSLEYLTKLNFKRRNYDARCMYKIAVW